MAIACVAHAEDAAPELAFFEGGKIVAQYHFSGPVTPLRSAWIRADGHILAVGRTPADAMIAQADGFSNGTPFRESQIDPARLREIERLARASGVCHAASTPGFSVGGAWMLVLDFGPTLRCKYRRRAHLEVPRPIARLRDAVTRALDDAAEAPALHKGEHDGEWPAAARSPL